MTFLEEIRHWASIAVQALEPVMSFLKDLMS